MKSFMHFRKLKLLFPCWMMTGILEWILSLKTGLAVWKIKIKLRRFCRIRSDLSPGEKQRAGCSGGV